MKALRKKKMTKTQEAALQKEEKKAQEAVAMARAAASTVVRAAEKEKERQRVAEEERLGCDARQGALSQLEDEVDGSGVHTKKVVNFLKLLKLQPIHKVLIVMSSDALAWKMELNFMRRIFIRDSDDWYVKTEKENEAVVEDKSEQPPAPTPRVEETDDAIQTCESDDALDGVALLAREKRRQKRKLEQERLAAAKKRIRRDWVTTISNWDELTRFEMDVLALDEEALKKMRVDGWNMDPNTQLEQGTQYPGLSTDEYGPTPEILEPVESPLRLFFYFMPPRLWRRIATESNRYYHQHLNERVDRIDAYLIIV
ncbi:hypothetical protein PHMEG_00025146 [Phytophthora megakarya]|uniref:Uncharacterized protein n=1 Tax=Phytophthora megakarya TaxID=4795 RepID=A0A225VCQ3_9STRA|nr:hypothetical protein PHMEG_00025146 [Phytophthora megakarya]